MTLKAELLTMKMDVKRYLHDILIHLRMHRATAGGISPQATAYFDLLVRCLGPMQGKQYVTPQMVQDAALRIFPHRLVITTPRRERSKQWGGRMELIAAYLAHVTPRSVVEDVLEGVEAPV